MSFKTRPNATTTVKVVQSFVPTVGISSEALAKMSIYVDECTEEIGWLGTAYKEGNEFYIEDVFLFDQDVHATTTEITPDGLTDFATELLAKGDEGMEIWNNLKMWGHSHVDMAVSPSGQDDAQMVTFKEGGHDWFIRLICNKKGELKVDLYDYQTGVTYLDLKWVEVMSEDEATIQDQIDELYALLEGLEEERIKKYEEGIKAEMKTKVREMKATSKYGYYRGGKWISYGSQSAKGEKKTTSTSNSKTHGGTTTTNATAGGSGKHIAYEDMDVFDSDDEVRNHFSDMELLELSECRRFDELEDELALYGYYDYFTDDDIERIFRVMNKIRLQKGYGY